MHPAVETVAVARAALNVITSVVAAPPGLLTSADIPLRGFAGRFKL
ncbi:MAG: hypothetical protein WAN71_09610 [Mycobacterium sp.]